MASSGDYASVPSTGKLKIKGVKDSKVDKKKKKKQKALDSGNGDDFEDKSVMLRSLQEEDAAMMKEGTDSKDISQGTEVGHGAEAGVADLGGKLKTEAERRYEEQRRKRLDERLKREGVKTHKQRVEELNRYLSGLSEHHDMPRIGPG